MLVSDFDFDLPQELIAQTPLERRDKSRLLLLDRASGSVRHQMFENFSDLLNPGDLLVLNDTKVIPARLHGTRPGGGQAELLLLEEVSKDCWKALAKPAKRLKPGMVLSFGELSAEVLAEGEHGERTVRFSAETSVRDLIERIGEMPLPPYIGAAEALNDPTRYQTVYAHNEGAVAAPTAGLHFTPDVLMRIRQKGIDIRYLTLHVGLGTFRPVSVERTEDHQMHFERYTLPDETISAILETKRRGGRVVAVGTTVARTLETCAPDYLQKCGETGIFITPGYQFKAVDALLTNFHLPCSTLIMLVSAFVEHINPSRGRETVIAAYREAIAQKYRFYSFGDAMFLA